VTAPARITQADIDRATKSVVAAGIPARIVLDLEKRRIEIIIGESAPPEPPPDQWTDEDV
jgi:hypothetical protein